MKVIYIGPNNPGSTSGMRANALKELLRPEYFHFIDTYVPFSKSFRLFRSIGFRYQIGPFISSLNQYIMAKFPMVESDMIWVDKASFITPETTGILRTHCKKLVHYTPDTAFFQNRSRLFENSMAYYDHFITTKSFDLEKYPSDKTIFITQGYDPDVHKPYHTFEEKTREVVFIGLFEPDRGKVIRDLLKEGIRVAIAGKKWNRFSEIKHPLMEYLGEGLFGEEYARIISSSYFGLGLLSKRFPELHTTRTFEIPACGTLLVTERNKETLKFFEEGDVLFYNQYEDLKTLIIKQLQNKKMLKQKTEQGHAKVRTANYTNTGNLQKVLWQIGY